MSISRAKGLNRISTVLCAASVLQNYNPFTQWASLVAAVATIKYRGSSTLSVGEPAMCYRRN